MGESEFLNAIGNLTILEAAGIIAAAAVIGQKLWEIYQWSRKYWSKTEKREKALSDAENLEEYHQQSVDIRAELQRQIKELQRTVNGIVARLDKRDELDRVRRMNKTRTQIIQMYGFYASEERNPMQAWTAMEADAFWRIFGDYEEDGGDGYVHSEIQPAMNTLRVIKMTEQEEILKLMQSRR